jgi:signal transduction histidine kinase
MSQTPSARILVVDDDKAVRETLKDMLELNGYEVITADNGARALATVRAESPALIISDVAMPDLDGFGLLTAIQADMELRRIPVIMVTAKAERAAMRRGMELGAADFITKPFTEEEVIHSTATRLAQKDLLDEIDAFSHTVAHDLKNPLASLMMRLELTASMVGNSDAATLRHHLAEASKAATAINRIIDELLILAGVRRQAVALKSLEMGPIVAETLERLESLLQQQSAHVQVPANWPDAVGHAPWVTEMWTNYVSNAAKYGGARPQITLGGEVRPDGCSTRFWVQDQGPGLDPKAQEKLFVPFNRVSSVRAKGHGLGLSIVRRIAEKLGGRVGVESAPGAGARFWFELPTALAANPSTELETRPPGQ